MQRADRPTTRNPERRSEEKGGTIRVLIADDCPEDMTLLQHSIRSACDMKVVGAAFDACDAVAKSVERSPTVVVMDAHLPQLGGLETTRRIKAKLPNVKVLLLSPSLLDITPFGLTEADSHSSKDCPDGDVLIKIRALAAGDAEETLQVDRTALTSRGTFGMTH